MNIIFLQNVSAIANLTPIQLAKLLRSPGYENKSTTSTKVCKRISTKVCKNIATKIRKRSVKRSMKRPAKKLLKQADRYEDDSQEQFEESLLINEDKDQDMCADWHPSQYIYEALPSDRSPWRVPEEYDIMQMNHSYQSIPDLDSCERPHPSEACSMCPVSVEQVVPQVVCVMHKTSCGRRTKEVLQLPQNCQMKWIICIQT